MGVVCIYIGTHPVLHMSSPIGAINAVRMHKGEYMYTCWWDLAYCLFHYLRAFERKCPYRYTSYYENPML